MRSILLAVLVTLGACGTDTSTHVNALTGGACEPDPLTYMPAPPKNDKCQGTSNGDNCDDLSSGKIDCIGDGNSGQGDDKKHNCVFPQPGCDETGCCDDDVVVPPGEGDGDGDDGTTPPEGDDGTTPPDGSNEPPPGTDPIFL